MTLPDYLKENIDLKTKLVTIKSFLEKLDKELDSKRLKWLIEFIGDVHGK